MKTIEKILMKAYVVLAEQGYEKASMSHIAKEVGISKPALYHYFKSKEDLFATLYDVILKEVSEVKPKKYKTKDQLRNLLIDKGNEDIQYQLDNPHFAQIIKQFSLIGLRNELIESKNIQFESIIRINFEKIFDVSIERNLYTPDEVVLIIDLLLLIDKSISEEIIRKTGKDYKYLWNESVYRIVN